MKQHGYISQYGVKRKEADRKEHCTERFTIYMKLRARKISVILKARECLHLGKNWWLVIGRRLERASGMCKYIIA